MQAFRILFVLLPLILTAGALVLLLLTVLAGGYTSSPLNKFYYLSAAVSVPAISSPDGFLHWTNYNVCGAQNGLNVNCGPTKAAYGYHPSTQLSDPTPQLPDQVSSHSSRSFITSRTYYAFLLIAIFFTFIAMIMSIAGFFGRLGSFIGFLSALFAWAVTTVAAALMTVVYVRGRNDFRSGGVQANVGVKLFAFMWTAMAALFLALLIFSIGICIPGDNSRKQRRTRATSYQEKPLVGDTESFVPVQATDASRTTATGTGTTYIVPNTTEPATSVYNDLPRSSYERAPRSGIAPPIDGTRAGVEQSYESTGTGATYLR